MVIGQCTPAVETQLFVQFAVHKGEDHERQQTDQQQRRAACHAQHCHEEALFVAEQVAALKEVDSKVDAINRDLQDFKETLPLLPSDADDVKAEVNKRVIDCLGGKNSNAYHDSSIRGKVYSDIYRELKRQFEVSKYNCIHRNQKNIAIEIVRNYEPPYVLAEEIKDSNAQLNLEDVDGV